MSYFDLSAHSGAILGGVFGGWASLLGRKLKRSTSGKGMQKLWDIEAAQIHHRETLKYTRRLGTLLDDRKHEIGCSDAYSSLQ